MLFNLTYGDENYVNCVQPTSLPEDQFCLVEIFDKNNNIVDVKGTYLMNENNANEKQEKQVILSDLDLSRYIDKLEIFLQRDDIDKDKIHLNFVQNIKDDNQRIKKIFVILLCSYLIYFTFLQFPFVVSLDLLNNKMFKYFTDFSPMNQLEKSFINQVSLLHRYFSEIFLVDENSIQTSIPNQNETFLKEEQYQKIENIIKEKIDLEVKSIAEDLKEFKKKMVSDITFRIKKYCKNERN